MVSVFGLSLLFLGVGAKGFTASGLPFTTKRRLTGARGRSVGALCLGACTLGVIAAFWFGSPVERHAMKLMTYGIIVGILGTLAVLRGSSEELEKTSA